MTYKIYKIIAHTYEDTDRFLCYVGSTKQTLESRMSSHEYKYRKYLNNDPNVRWVTSFKLLQKPWYEMSLVEDLGNVSKREAERREGQHIKALSADADYLVVNDHIPGRTKNEYRKDKHAEISEWNHKYYLENKDKKQEYDKQRNQHKIQCECGGSYSKKHQQEHFRTKKHQQFILT